MVSPRGGRASRTTEMGTYGSAPYVRQIQKLWSVHRLNTVLRSEYKINAALDTAMRSVYKINTALNTALWPVYKINTALNMEGPCLQSDNELNEERDERKQLGCIDPVVNERVGVPSGDDTMIKTPAPYLRHIPKLRVRI